MTGDLSPPPPSAAQGRLAVSGPTAARTPGICFVVLTLSPATQSYVVSGCSCAQGQIQRPERPEPRALPAWSFRKRRAPSQDHTELPHSRAGGSAGPGRPAPQRPAHLLEAQQGLGRGGQGGSALSKGACYGLNDVIKKAKRSPNSPHSPAQLLRL